MVLMTKTEKQPFEYETPEEYYEQFFKRNFTFEIDTRPIGEAEIIAPKEYENGSLDLPKHYKLKVKDKISKKVVIIDNKLRERFKTYALETPTERRMTPLEYVLRQKSRFDGKTEVFSIRREPERAIIRFLKPNEKPRHEPELYIYITFHWVGAGLCHSIG